MTPEVKACQTAGPGYCTRNGPPPDRDVIGQRPGEIAGFVDIYLQRRTPAHAAAVPQPGRKGRFPIVVQVGDYHPTGAALEDQQLLQGAVTPDAVKRSQIRRPGRGLLLPERGLRPQKPGEKGGQGPDRRPVGLFSQPGASPAFRRLSALSRTAANATAGGCRFRLHLLQRARTTSSSGIVCPEPAQSSRVRAAVSGVSSSTCTATVSQVVSRDRPLPWGLPSRAIIAISRAAIRMLSHAPFYFCQHTTGSVWIPPQISNSLFFRAWM